MQTECSADGLGPLPPLLLALALAMAAPARGAAPASPCVEILSDLLEALPSAQVSNPKATEARRPATAGGVRQHGLFAHPAAPKQPARVAYSLDLPRAETHDLLLLAFDIALADGIKPGPGVDGVRFSVELDGRTLFSEATSQTRWQSHAVDLTPWAGRRVTLGLVTDGLLSTSYDWSVWGSPRVLALRGVQPLQPGPDGKLVSPVVAGVLALRGPTASPVKLRLRPTGGGSPMEWDVGPLQARTNLTPWAAKDFSFAASNLSAVAIEWEPPEALAASNLLLAAYPPRLEWRQFAPARAVLSTEEPVPLRLAVKNVGRGPLGAGQAQVLVQTGAASVPVSLPALAPGESWSADWSWRPPARAGRQLLKAELRGPDGVSGRSSEFEVFGRPSDLRTIQNDRLKIEFARQPAGYAYARLYARQERDWAPVAVWHPLLQLLSDTKAGEQAWQIQPRSAPAWRAPGLNVRNSVQFTERRRDADGVEWEVRLAVRLESNAPVARLRYEWKAAQDRQVRALLGPNLYVGEGTTGAAKTWGLFPGLEYLFGAEQSSNERDFAPALADRRTPHPHKLTVPLMAVTIGPDSQVPPERPDRFFCPDSLKDLARPPGRLLKSQISNLKSDLTVALLWNPLQRWDGERPFPSPRFASPNFDEGMDNHRLALFLPSVPDFVPENGLSATNPYALPAGKTLTLEATLLVAPGPVTVALRQWLQDNRGLPPPHPWPRTFQQQLDVCRAGLLKTLWDDKAQGWRHCIDWAAGPAPGLAALLWLDSHLAADPQARAQARARVELAVTNMLRDGGPGLLTSQAACHIMQWEFPFLYGYLAEAMPAIDGQVRGLIRSQRPDGGWVFQPGNDQQKDLGAAGDSVLGLSAHRASTLLRYARVTGDTNALAAGERALRFMEQFRVPRGAQVWECPMYEPDVLAAAYAIRAYQDAWRITGNPRWLHAALYWAETGVPFVYLWTLPDKPMMLGASIPVFGSTFYTHSWLAMPVQWNGLVYSYHLFHLSEELAHAPLPARDSPLPLALNLGPADWRRLVELITVSGLYQQYAEGPRIGSYPDSISRFEQRNPAFLNPEDILVNVLALQGHDPDVKTVRLRRAGREVVISSGALIQNAQRSEGGVAFELAFFPGEPSHTLLVGLKPREVRVNGQLLPVSATPPRRAPGWWWDEKTGRAYLTVPHAERLRRVEVTSE